MYLRAINFLVQPDKDGRYMPEKAAGVAYKIMVECKRRYFFVYMPENSSFFVGGKREWGFVQGDTIQRDKTCLDQLVSNKSGPLYPVGIHLLLSYEEAHDFVITEWDRLVFRPGGPGEDGLAKTLRYISRDSGEGLGDLSLCIWRVRWLGKLAEGIYSWASDYVLPDYRVLVVDRITLDEIVERENLPLRQV